MSKIIGSRAQVWHGTATHTSGGLTKDDLMMNKHKRIVSKRRHAAGQTAIKHLEKSGHKGKLPSRRRGGSAIGMSDKMTEWMKSHTKAEWDALSPEQRAKIMN